MIGTKVQAKFVGDRYRKTASWLSSIWDKHLGLPSPVDLGWSKYNALPLENFCQPGEKTWDDWKRHCSTAHPVKYFLNETIVRWSWHITGPVGRAVYWVKCHTLPKYRFHKFDFRGVDPMDDYTHGYMDPCSVMYLAAWGALRRFVEKCKPLNPDDYPDDDIPEFQRNNHREALALYDWWMNGRKLEREQEDKHWNTAKSFPRGSEQYVVAMDAWLGYHKWREANEQVMFMRLAAIREYLWT